MRPPSVEIRNTSPNPPILMAANIPTSVTEPIIIKACITSVHTTALMPP